MKRTSLLPGLTIGAALLMAGAVATWNASAQDAPPADDAAEAAAAVEAEAPEGEAAAAAEQPVRKDAAPASDSESSTMDEVLDSGAFGLLKQGGFFMWPLLLMGILAAGVIMERYRSLKMLRTDASEVRGRVRKMLEGDQVEEALTMCDREEGPVPAVLSAGLRQFLILRRLQYDAGRIQQQVVKGMEDYSVHIVAALERHLPILATIASAAPMIGFLGTVQGMIVAFGNIVAKMGQENIVVSAAGGIKVSLLTTCLGLIVGIPAFIAFNYFTSVINRFVLEVEESASDLVETVTLQMAMEPQA